VNIGEKSIVPKILKIENERKKIERKKSKFKIQEKNSKNSKSAKKIS